MVILHTNHGDITLELDAENAPATVGEFPAVRPRRPLRQHVFHRVIDGFMIQGGGFEPGMKQKPTRDAGRQRSRQRPQERALHGRDGAHSDPHSATAQFFINVADNAFLDYKGAEPAGLGLLRVRQGRRGQDVVDRIAGVATGRTGFHQNVPTRGRRDHARRGSRVTATRRAEQRGSADGDGDREADAAAVGSASRARRGRRAAAAFDAFARGPAREAAARLHPGRPVRRLDRRRPAARAVRRRDRRIAARHQRRRRAGVRRARQSRLPAGRPISRATAGATLLPEQTSSTSAARRRC